MKALLIAEKPSLKRAIEEVYNKHKNELPYQISSFVEQRGHLLTLKMPNEIDPSLETWSWDTLPIYPEDYKGWQYKVIQEKKQGNFLTSKERFDLIKKEINSGEYDFIINAGDPDQEGQLLIRIVLSALGNKLPVKRYWTNATTEEKILEALKSLKDDDNDPMLVNLLRAAYGRQHSDWRFGINISRAASMKTNARVACGRVKTPILSIICKREIDINNFQPSTCYGVTVKYTPGFTGQLYDKSSSLESSEETKENESSEGLIWFDTKEEAINIINSLGREATVVHYESKKVESYAPKLFKLASAQIAAGKLGYDSAKTLSIIQSLYEKGYLTYPRTDCEYISSTENLKAMINSASAVPSLEKYINKIEPTTISKVRATKKWVNDKALESSGHSALTPTSKKPDFEALTHEEKDIYTMICRQFVAIFLPPLVQNKVLLITDINGKFFKSTGKTLISPGYTAIFNSKFTDNDIPSYEKGNIIFAQEFSPNEKTTTCPKRFTDADLIAACEAPHRFLEDTSLKNLGKRLSIGTPATRATIIQELINRDKYLMVRTDGKNKHIVPTQVGMSIYENLKDYSICKVDMTGEWEIKLESIRNGEMTLSSFEEEIKNAVNSMILDIKNSQMSQIKVKSIDPIGKCPLCGGDIIESEKSFYCSNYKHKGCRVGAFKAISESKLSSSEFLSLLAGNQIDKTLRKNGFCWKQPLRYDFSECKIIFIQAETLSTAYKCPNCGELLTDTGNVIKCNSCSFSFWKSCCGKLLTNTQINNFFTKGNSGVIKGLKSKAGKYFDASIVFDKDKNGTKFIFPQKEN